MTGLGVPVGVVRKGSQSSVMHGSRYGGERIGRVSGLEFCAGDAALPDARKECADGELRVIRNRDCARPCVGSTLHHHMATASPGFAKAVFLKNLAGISTGRNAQFTPALLRSAL